MSSSEDSEKLLMKRKPAAPLILDATLSELLEIRAWVDLEKSLRFYVNILTDYLKGEPRSLKEAIEDFRRENRSSRLLPLAELRLQIRTDSPKVKTIQAVLEQAERDDDPLWRGEAHFVLARAFEILKQYENARDHFGLAARWLEQGGARKKSVKSLLNFVVAESLLHPEKKLIADYHMVYRKAKKARELGTAGSALLNISREYQKLNATSTALKYVNRAITLLEPERGSRCHELALAHRCHLLAEVGRLPESLSDLEQIEGSSFSEVQGAIQVLRKFFFEKQMLSSQIGNLHPSWAERLRDESGAPNARKRTSSRSPELEERVLTLISQGPVPRFELIKHVYGTQISSESAENRLKNLMNRLRKKYPGAIVLEAGSYRLVDSSILDSKDAPKPRKKSA